MEYSFCYDTKIGNIEIREKQNCISYVGFNKGNCTIKETPLIKKAYKELTEYFNGKRKSFDLPLLMEGTEFQKRVWNALLTIPYGKTCSYLEIAQKIGSPKACRAVGLANHNNPIIIIVPCHRVIGKNGKLVRIWWRPLAQAGFT